MTALSIQAPFPTIPDIDGQPLEDGYIWIGVANLAPITNPITVYWDAALTLPAAQPVRTLGGYPMNSGTPGRLYAATDYSILVQNKTGSTVYSSADNNGPLFGGTISSVDVTFLQAGAGAVERTAQAKMRDVVSVKDFGAVGNGVVDDTAAIQAAADYANSIGGTLFADSGTYRITSTVTITCNCQMSAALFNVNAASVAIALIVGSTTQEIRGRVMSLPRLNNTAKTTTGWTGFSSSVGVDLANLMMSHIIIPSVNKFGIGVDVGGYTTGNAYNNIFLGELFDNKINLRLRKKTAAPLAYSNQNAYYGGQYGMSGAEGTSIAGSYSISLEASTNNNTFINPSLENNGNQFQVLLSDSSFNTFINPRFEVTGGGRVNFYSSFTGGSQQNTFIGGYNFAAPVFTYTGSESTFNRIIGDKSGDAMSWETTGMSLLNQNGSGPSTPIITGFQANATGIRNLLGVNAATTTLYGFKLFAEGLNGKRYTDTYDRVRLDWSAGKLFLGENSGPISAFFQGQPSNNWMVVGGCDSFIPQPDNAISLGTSGFRWSATYSTQFRPGAGNVIWTSGAGTPEGAVTAPVGSLFTRTDGGAGTTLYVKETGSGNTGWVAK